MNTRYSYCYTSLILAALLSAGCASTGKLSNLQDLRKQVTGGPITLLTKDSSLYHLDRFRIEDSDLSGVGSVERQTSTTVFRGEIPFREIRYIESSDVSTGQTVLALIAGAVFVGFAATAIERSQGFKLDEQTHYVAPPGSGGSGSCPLLYSFDGSGYVFESEAAGGAMSPFLEYTILDDLNHLRAVDGKYQILLTQDEFESDHVDQLHLVTVDHRPGVRVLADSANELHTLGTLIAPSHAWHNRMGDCTAALRAKDGQCWQSDITTNPLVTASDFRDELTLSFPRPLDAKHVKLVINGRNTALGDYALATLMGLAGNDRLRWYDALDHNPAAAYALDGFIRREAWLHVEVLERDGWHERAAFRDPGQRADRWQLAVLDLSGIDGDSVTIRLSSTADLWKLDAVALDCSPDEVVKISEVIATSAIAKSGRDVAPLLAAADGRHLDMTCGDSTILTFNVPPPAAGLERSVFARTTAYFHSWFYREAAAQPEFREAVYAVPQFGTRTVLPLWKKICKAEQ